MERLGEKGEGVCGGGAKEWRTDESWGKGTSGWGGMEDVEEKRGREYLG